MTEEETSWVTLFSLSDKHCSFSGEKLSGTKFLKEFIKWIILQEAWNNIIVSTKIFLENTLDF